MNGIYPFETIALLNCIPPIVQSGPTAASCLTSGNWDHGAPTCTKGNQVTV